MNKYQKWGIFGVAVVVTFVLWLYGAPAGNLIVFNAGIIGTCFVYWLME